jgi:hypothetical protein
MTAPANRAMTITRWIVAVALSGATALLLIGLFYGYVLAVKHQLPPNGTFGFRDATTFSCLPAWYAGQKAGFTWLLFGGGPLLVFNIVVCFSAPIQRRSPWEVYAVSMGTLLLLAVILVIAAIHADGVARAANQGAACSPPALEQFGPSIHLLNRLTATVTAGSFALAEILISVLLIRNWSRAATGRLQRNPYFGLRTPTTMRSEQAWVAGNRAALRLVPLYPLICAATVIALLATATFASAIPVVVTGIGCITVFFALIIYTAIFASRSARSADDFPH